MFVLDGVFRVQGAELAEVFFVSAPTIARTGFVAVPRALSGFTDSSGSCYDARRNGDFASPMVYSIASL